MTQMTQIVTEELISNDFQIFCAWFLAFCRNLKEVQLHNQWLLDNLSIETHGKSNIEISSYEDKSKAYAVKNLTINTFDVADVKVENIKIDNCSGSFSDQTTVQMPAVNLNQMYKK